MIKIKKERLLNIIEEEIAKFRFEKTQQPLYEKLATDISYVLTEALELPNNDKTNQIRIDIGYMLMQYLQEVKPNV